MVASFFAIDGIGHGKQSKVCQFESFWSTQTNMQRHFGITTTARREATITTLIDDLDRTLQLVQYDIAVEEERAGICDRTDARYPVLAGALASRRDNLKVTIAALAKQLATIGEGRTDDALGWGARGEPAPGTNLPGLGSPPVSPPGIGAGRRLRALGLAHRSKH